MTVPSTVPRLRLVLQDDDLFVSTLSHDLGRDLGAGYRRRPKRDFAASRDHQDVVQLDVVAEFVRQRLGPDSVSWPDAILLPACSYDGVVRQGCTFLTG